MTGRENLSNVTSMPIDEESIVSEIFTLTTLKIVLILIVVIYSIIIFVRNKTGKEERRKGIRYISTFIKNIDELTVNKKKISNGLNI